MAKRALSLRVDVELVERVDAWAADHGTTRTGAVEALVGAALDECERDDDAAGSGTTDDARGELLAAMSALRDSNVTLRETVASLTARLSEAMQLADQAQKLQAIAEKKLLPPDEGERATMGQRWRRWWSGR